MNRRTEFKVINQFFFNNDIAPNGQSQRDLVMQSLDPDLKDIRVAEEMNPLL
jgi:hypothetical protein